jgi:histone-lysine N-methyltransferase SETD2
MKCEIRNQLRELAFPESTSLKAPKDKAISKGATKKVVVKGSSRVTRSTGRLPSRWEHVDKQFPDTQESQNKPTSSKKRPSAKSTATVSETPSTRIIPHIDDMPKFMHKYIDDIIDVEGDGYCGYRCVALDYSGNEEDFELVKCHMLRELNLHKELYLKVYAHERRYNYIKDAIYPPKRKVIKGHVAPIDKWLTFPDMGHILATHYKKIFVLLTAPGVGISETCFPLRGAPPSDPEKSIVCLGLVPGHFRLVKLKPGCPLPPTCLEWKNHRTEEAAAWEYPFMDRQSTFAELLAKQMKDVKKKIITGVGSSKDEPYIF